ncbi:sensor histidine kinase [Streptacidiphilus sp. MAP5-3]|uniref:sensor histidine kinase n=1 Tax=unclassified Streptacidiphilus TaxID=2643834 RepID=UPI00351401DD
MQAVRRVVDGDLDRFLDAGVAVTAAVLAAVAAWGVSGPIGTIHGPAWLRVLLPLALGAPLLLRRRAPLLMWAAIWAGIALLTLVGGHPPQGLYLLFVLFCGAYALGAHAGFRDAVIGLVGTVPVIALIGLGGVGVGLGAAPLVVFWLAGVLVRARRQQTALAERNAELERKAEQVRAAERTRIARELHDIVAHHLSVIVLQASGARASGASAESTLEKIENSGRQALKETRRLLGVLREANPDTGFAPQPGIGELDGLATSVRAAGLPVSLIITGDHTDVPAAVDVSVYRIVQEALTNVLKHADATHAEVAITCAHEAVTIEVTDSGSHQPPNPTPAGGHGLTGMRERVAIFGGELSTGPHPGGGFAVRVRLPLQDGPP